MTSDEKENATGAIANGALHVIGNSYVGHFQPDGTIKEAGRLQGTAIIAVPLRKVEVGDSLTNVGTRSKGHCYETLT